MRGSCATLKVKTHVKAGGLNVNNHNEALVRDPSQTKGLRVKTLVAPWSLRPGVVPLLWSGFHLYIGEPYDACRQAQDERW
jgi:hypothetical protein